jgi:hypothetical protein
VLAAHPDLPRHILQADDLEKPEQRLVALGETGDPEHLPEIIKGLSHADSSVRRLAASALGKIGHLDAVEALLSTLADETHPQVRQYSIKALGKIGDPRAQQTLEQIAVNPDEQEYNRKSAQYALQNLQLPITNNQSPTLQPSPPPGSPIAIILDAVAKLGGTLGRTGLAQFLSGSQAAWLETFVDHSCYGQLAHLSQRAILDMIDALITDGRLLTTGSNRPKLIVPEQRLNATDQEKQASDRTNNESSQTKEIEEPPGSISPVDSAPNATVLEALRRWRAEQARSQQLAPFIIFSNQVLAEIATLCPRQPEALLDIRGVGPAKVEQYGLAVIEVVREALAQTEPS